MITLLFLILMVAVFVELVTFSIKFMWGLGKVLCYIIFLPVVLIVMAASGLIFLALPILAIVGIVALVKALVV